MIQMPKMAESKIILSKVEKLVKLKSNEELKLIIQQANPDGLTDNCGTTLLHLAAKHNNAELIKYLLRIGYDSNIKNICGTTPLLMAASYNSSEALGVLLDVNADIFVPAVKGKSTLQMIVDGKRGIPSNIIVDVLKHLRKKLVDADKTADLLTQAGCPLDYVFLMNDAEVTEMMLNRKQYLGPKECHRVMECAMEAGHLENIRVLLEYGRGDYVSMTAYVNNLCNMIDSTNANLTSAQFYVEQMDNWNLYEHFWLIAALRHVFEEKPKDIVEFFLDCGVDEHVRNNYDFDLIVDIFGNSNFKASELLEDRQFNVNALNMNRASGLCVAAAAGLKRNLKFLLKKGANVNMTDNYGLTPMHYSQSTNCVIPLLKRGADLQIIGKQGQTVFDAWNDSSFVKIAHLAMMEAQGVRVKRKIRDKINADSEMKYLLEKCGLQLDWMRNLKIFRNITLFTVLLERIEKFAHCIRSQESVNLLLNKCKVSGIHDYYYIILHRKLNKAAEMYDLKCNAARIISEFMGIHYAGHLVVEMIIDFLSLDDLRLFDWDE